MRVTMHMQGLPIAKGRPRMTRTGHTYTPQKTKAYEERVAETYKVFAKIARAPIVDKPCTLDIQARFPIPQSAKRKKIADLIADGDVYGNKPDIDNCIKSILDGLNGVAFTDDKLVYAISSRKVYSDNPGITVTVEWED